MFQGNFNVFFMCENGKNEHQNMKHNQKFSTTLSFCQCNFCFSVLSTIDAMLGLIFETAHRRSDSTSNSLFQAFVLMVTLFEKADLQR